MTRTLRSCDVPEHANAPDVCVKCAMMPLEKEILALKASLEIATTALEAIEHDSYMWFSSGIESFRGTYETSHEAVAAYMEVMKPYYKSRKRKVVL
jgi:hypothetical protein